MDEGGLTFRSHAFSSDTPVDVGKLPAARSKGGFLGRSPSFGDEVGVPEADALGCRHSPASGKLVEVDNLPGCMERTPSFG
mmetsp:Transcript_50688/g.156928  ORF Transcript_50688/g.156928 Transcript_50688/m.156928 type:complete len:81 (+) Transcript_50688:226-468(+)